MKIDVISDMHVEMNERWPDTPAFDGVEVRYPWHLEKQSDILLIAGDCSNSPHTTVEVINEASRFYDRVIFTDGNHDHYVGGTKDFATVANNSRYFRTYADATPGVEYLNGSTVQIEDTLFIGANGWYDWTAHAYTSKAEQYQRWLRGSNDAVYVSYDMGMLPDVLACRQAGRITELVEDAQYDDSIERIVIMTHTIPHRTGMVPDNHPWGPLNGAFFNKYMSSVWHADGQDKIKCWAFGHTHFHADFSAHGIRFVNNARGYHGELTEKTVIKQIDLTLPVQQSAFGDTD